MSRFSPGPVDNSEELARLIFDFQYNVQLGELTPNALSGFETQGLSVCRSNNDILDPDELARVIKSKVDKAREGKNPEAEWVGVVITTAWKARNLPNNPVPREFCVYDTALAEFKSHADITQTKYSECMKKRRIEIRKIFSRLIRREDFFEGKV